MFLFLAFECGHLVHAGLWLLMCELILDSRGEKAVQSCINFCDVAL